MVRLGAAWVYRQYAQDKTLYSFEDQARKEKAGLWALPESERMPPWEWRKAKRNGGESTKKVSSKGFNCGGKTKCSQMSSCKEARYYLIECGLSRLDGNRDGVPCESLCR